MSTLWQDVKYSLRMLAKSPGFAAVAVLTLGLGIGANTAIFTLLDAVVLKTLPVSAPGELVLFTNHGSQGTQVTDPPPTGKWEYFSYPLFTYLHDRDRAFTDLAAFRSGQGEMAVHIEGQSGGGVANRAIGHLVSGNYFSVMGVSALIGRTLLPSDDIPAAKPAAVVSYGYWQTQFAGNPGALGQTVVLNRTPFTIVGVMPASFFGERMAKAPDFWIPLHFQPQIELADSMLTQKNAYWLNLIGRLKRGESIAQANAIVDVQLHQFLTEQAGDKLTAESRKRIAASRIALAPGARGISSLRIRYSQPLLILFAAVGLVLLIACANVANLLLARSAARQREISMRVALGATRGRLLRQGLVESVVLAALGAAAGALFAAWGVNGLVGLLGEHAFVNVHPDARVLLFTLGVLLLTALLFGIAPALRASRVEPMLVLREHSSWAASRAAHSALLRGLVVLQVAMSLWLLVGAGLLSRSLLNLQSQSFGFNPSHVLLIDINPRLGGLKPAELPNLYQSLYERLNTLPGVESATIASYSPLSGTARTNSISLPGHPSRPSDTSRDVGVVLVGPRYVETLGFDLVAGREIGPQDTAASGMVAMVNEAFVKANLAGQTPIGQRFGFGDKPDEISKYAIIGVIKDSKFYDVDEPPMPMVFLAFSQNPDPMSFMSELELRAHGNPAAAAAEVRRAVAEIDNRVPVTDVDTLSHQVDTNFRQVRLTADVAGLFSLLALVLAAVGLYGLLAYSVAQRTNEFGVRMALGARPFDVFRMVLGKGLRLVGLGLVIGLAGAFALTRALGSLLYGISAADPLTFVATAVLLLAVTALASYVPARRATRVDPAIALRNE